MSCTLVRSDHFPPHGPPTTRAARKEINRHEPLAHALAALHIKPLDKISVKLFQEEKSYAHMQLEMEKIQSERAAYKTRTWKNLGWILAALLAYIYASEHFHVIINSYIAGVCSVACYFFLEKVFRKDRLELEWKSRESHARQSHWMALGYETYKNTPFIPNPVPNFIQDSVKDIKARLPKARFEVEFFYDDPFLLVMHSGPGLKDEFFYLYAWDEKGFVIP